MFRTRPALLSSKTLAISAVVTRAMSTGEGCGLSSFKYKIIILAVPIFQSCNSSEHCGPQIPQLYLLFSGLFLYSEL